MGREEVLGGTKIRTEQNRLRGLAWLVWMRRPWAQWPLRLLQVSEQGSDQYKGEPLPRLHGSLPGPGAPEMGHQMAGGALLRVSVGPQPLPSFCLDLGGPAIRQSPDRSAGASPAQAHPHPPHPVKGPVHLGVGAAG